MREAKQQAFVETLVRRVHDAADDTEPFELFIAEFLIAVLEHFAEAMGP